MIFWLPAAAIFSATLPMSQGERNCAFFTLTMRPVLAAATRRSVWRDRKAGVCKMFTTSAAGGAWGGAWVAVGRGRWRAGLNLPGARKAAAGTQPANALS